MPKNELILTSLLSRSEMKSVFGGNELSDAGWCQDACQSDSDCPDGMMGYTYSCKTGMCDNAPTKMCFLNP